MAAFLRAVKLDPMRGFLLVVYPALNQVVQAAIDDPEVAHIGMLHSDDKLFPVHRDGL